jgi:small-conductance mechanosensitive channel
MVLKIVRDCFRSYLKNASDSRWRRCTPLKSAHNLPRLLRFFIDVRLALSSDLLFFKMAYRLTGAPRKIKAA